MPPPAILDPSTLDFSKVLITREQIRVANPQRFEFELLDGLVYADQAALTYAGFHDVKADDWWVRGHVPGRPLFPGVLMIEVAAQLASYVGRTLFSEIPFFGFGGVDEVKFRGAVIPPERFIIIGKCIEARRRRVICSTQGFVKDTMVFEGLITGLPV